MAGIWLVFFRTAPEERRAAKLVAVVGAAGLAGPFLLALGGLDIFLQKSMIGSLVPLIVALAIGLGASRSGRTGLVVLGALCALSDWASWQRWTRTPRCSETTGGEPPSCSGLRRQPDAGRQSR